MHAGWLWRAAPLERPRDIGPRALFRLLWCALGGAVAVLLYGGPIAHAPGAGLLAVLVLLIAAAGALVDAFRLSLRSKRNS